MAGGRACNAAFREGGLSIGAIGLVFILGSGGEVRAATGPDNDLDGYTVAAGDCDDNDDTKYPGAFDRWYDGIDADCDGADDYDRDVDGWQVPEDCADLNPEIHPEAEEALDDVDQDCDGFTDAQFPIAPRGGATCATAPGSPLAGALALLWLSRRRWSR